MNIQFSCLQFHSKSLLLIPYMNTVDFQVSLSAGSYNSQKNVITVEGNFDQSEDPNRFRAVHCFLFPTAHICQRKTVPSLTVDSASWPQFGMVRQWASHRAVNNWRNAMHCRTIANPRAIWNVQTAETSSFISLHFAGHFSWMCFTDQTVICDSFEMASSKLLLFVLCSRLDFRELVSCLCTVQKQRVRLR